MNQRRKNLLKHIVRSLQHFVVPKPNHAKSAASQVLRSLDVVQQVIRMLPSIDFDDEPRADANEVHDISTNRLLAPEPVIAEMPITQMTPQTAFGV